MVQTVFNWPFPPSQSVVHAPKSLVVGQISSSGYRNDAMRMGVRNRVEMSFGTRLAKEKGRLYSWLLQQAGSYFLVPVYNTPQLVGFPEKIPTVPFDGGATFSNGSGFAGSMTMDTAASALAGENVVQVDTTRYPAQLQHGHVFGIGFGAYHVDDVTYDGNIATVTTAQPLKRDIASGEFVNLRPNVLCKTDDMASFKQLFETGRFFSPGSIILTEVIDNDYL